MLANFCRRWFDLCCLWLPKTEGEQASGAATTRSRTTTDNISSGDEIIEGTADKNLPESDADDLTVIKGIGPAVQKRLRSFGIMSLADLAAFDPDELIRKLSALQPTSATRVRSWIEAAQDRTARRA